MGQDRIEQLLQLVGEKAVEEEVRDDQVVGARGIPGQRIGVMQADAVLVAGTANTTLEKREHGTAGVNDIGGHGGIDCQETGEEAAVPVSQ